MEGNQAESPPIVTEVNGETEKRSKDKKKRKDKLSNDGDAEELQVGDPNGTDLKKDNFETSNEDTTDKNKKDSKKRKRATSDETDVPADGKVDEEPKRIKIEKLTETEKGEQSAKMNGNLKSNSNSNEENTGDLENTGGKSSIQRSQKKQQKGSVEVCYNTLLMCDKLIRETH